jgi:methyl-accepting chemotaxis protein
MGWVAFVCGVAGAAALVAATVILVREALACKRAFSAFSEEATPQVERIQAASDEAAAKAERLNEHSERLEVALQRFSVSRARLNVLIAAVQDVRATVQRVTDVSPKKGRA